jgi:hypothetical protein
VNTGQYLPSFLIFTELCIYRLEATRVVFPLLIGRPPGSRPGQGVKYVKPLEQSKGFFIV